MSKFCPACGAKNDDGDLFCMECGTRLMDAQEDGQNISEDALYDAIEQVDDASLDAMIDELMRNEAEGQQESQASFEQTMKKMLERHRVAQEAEASECDNDIDDTDDDEALAPGSRLAETQEDEMNISEEREAELAQLERKAMIARQNMLQMEAMERETIDVDDNDDDEEKCDVVLEDCGSSPLQVIKMIKQELGLGLKEAKDLAEATPSLLMESADVDAAKDLASRLRKVGARVTVNGDDGTADEPSVDNTHSDPKCWLTTDGHKKITLHCDLSQESIDRDFKLRYTVVKGLKMKNGWEIIKVNKVSSWNDVTIDIPLYLLSLDHDKDNERTIIVMPELGRDDLTFATVNAKIYYYFNVFSKSIIELK